ncbi:MAG: glycosyltransferase [Coriobacteriia bacterium]|nr:glycosyltransferase [Coriobacteriia bacterium]
MPLPDRPMRVTMVNKYYWPPHLGGVETVVRNLSEGLVAQTGASVRAIVCNEGRERVEDNIEGVEVVRLSRQFALSSAPIALSMPGALRAEANRPSPPDIINLHFPYPWGELSWLQAHPDIPMVLSYHSDIVRQKRMLAAYRPFLEAALDRADVITTSSPNLRDGSPFLSTRANKVRIVDYGLHVDDIAEPSASVLARAEKIRAEHAGRKIVLFVGRLVYYKGADVLVRAMANVDADVIFVGRGPLESELREIAAANGVASRTTWVAPTGDDELHAYYHAADVFALPSVANSEAFGLVQIEAHAAGTPAVSTNLPTSVPYANLDGVTGIMVPVGDVAALAEALNRLLADDELRARLGAQARERALTTFTIPRMVEQMLDVYAEAIDVHAAKRGRS